MGERKFKADNYADAIMDYQNAESYYPSQKIELKIIECSLCKKMITEAISSGKRDCFIIRAVIREKRIYFFKNPTFSIL